MFIRCFKSLFFSITIGVMFLAADASFAKKPTTTPKEIIVKTDRENALYKCGEQAVFVISNENGKEKDIKVVLAVNGRKVIESKEMKVENKTIVQGTLSEPGFIRCEVQFDADGQKQKIYAAAGFEPEKIKAETIMPDDFDAFWNNGIKELEKIPMDVKIEPLPEYSNENAQCCKISFANIDNSRIYAYIGIPIKKQAPFPAFIAIPGAGLNPRSPAWVKGWAEKGAISLEIGVHSYDLQLPRNEIEEKYEYLKHQKAYIGVTVPEKYYYYRTILGIDRIIKYIVSRPDFDKRHLVIHGSSQGGGLSLIMSGLNPNITACAVNVPALCDHGGYLAGRTSGWPGFVPIGNPEANSYLAASRYYDAVNFAKKIKCPVIVSVGFIDNTCSPGSVYSAYNEIKTPKRIFADPSAGHDAVKSFYSFLDAWVSGQLGLGKSIPPCVEDKSL